MAVQVRSRRLVNPARKRRKNSAKKKMSAKQIKFFGTARQKASLRASRSRKRNAGKFSVRKTKKDLKKLGYKSVSVITGTYKDHARAARKRRKARRNVGEIVSISLAGLGNPGRKRRKNGMVRRHKKLKMTKSAIAARRYARKHRNAGVRRRRHAHRNPGRRMNARRRRNSAVVIRRINARRYSRRRNPSLGGLTSGIMGKVVGVAAGAVGSRYLPQLVLGGNNVGVIGYVGNLVSAVALGYVGKMLTKSADFGSSVMAGGIASTLLRIMSDYTSIGTYINTALSGAGRGGDIGLGIIQNSSFPLPQVAVPGSMTNFITPRQTRSYVGSQISNQMAQTAQMRSAGSTGMGTVFGRRKRAVM